MILSTDIVDHEYIVYHATVLLNRNSDMIIWSWIDFDKYKNKLVIEILPTSNCCKKEMVEMRMQLRVLLNSAMDHKVYNRCSLSICGF